MPALQAGASGGTVDAAALKASGGVLVALTESWGTMLTVSVVMTAIIAAVLITYFKYYKPRLTVSLPPAPEPPESRLMVTTFAEDSSKDSEIFLELRKDIERELLELRLLIEDNEKQAGDSNANYEEALEDLRVKMNTISHLCIQRGEKISEILGVVNALRERFSDINKKLDVVEKHLFDILLHGNRH